MLKTHLTFALSLGLLVACAPPDVDETASIFIRLTGAEGPAAGQVGTALIRPDDTVLCRFQTPGQIGGPIPPAIQTTAQAPDLFQDVQSFLEENADVGAPPASGDMVFLNSDSETLAISQERLNEGGPETLNVRVAQLINQAIAPQTCFPWG